MRPKVLSPKTADSVRANEGAPLTPIVAMLAVSVPEFTTKVLDERSEDLG
jgi:hypothetical protein